jgi:hypothetical protein
MNVSAAKKRAPVHCRSVLLQRCAPQVGHSALGGLYIVRYAALQRQQPPSHSRRRPHRRCSPPPFPATGPRAAAGSAAGALGGVARGERLAGRVSCGGAWRRGARRAPPGPSRPAVAGRPPPADSPRRRRRHGRRRPAAHSRPQKPGTCRAFRARRRRPPPLPPRPPAPPPPSPGRARPPRAGVRPPPSPLLRRRRRFRLGARLSGPFRRGLLPVARVGWEAAPILLQARCARRRDARASPIRIGESGAAGAAGASCRACAAAPAAGGREGQ